MKEDFLHFLWKFKLFNSVDLKTTEGESVQVLKSGLHNHDSGPDFSHAKILIGEKEWSGNLEIHLKSSDWYKHHHQDDPAYKNVILHVVFEHDKEVFLHQKGDLPVLELKNFISHEYLNKYKKLENSRGWIPCQNQFPLLDEFKVNQWLERMVVNRLQRKSTALLRIYFETDKDWNETFYRWLSRSFGFKINSEAMENLAKKTPFKLIKKHANSLFQIEALLFGQAGFLNQEFTEEYPKSLKREYLFLKEKYHLNAINPSEWKFSKTHPSNFPTKRIAQLATFLANETNTFSKVLEIDNPEVLRGKFAAETSEYWKNHYRLDKPTSQIRSRKMGKSSLDGLIINSISTLLFTYGRKTENEVMVSKAILLLENCSKETNGIIKKWIELGIQPNNAKHTQGLIELKREYCEKKKCLSCTFGSEILKNKC